MKDSDDGTDAASSRQSEQESDVESSPKDESKATGETLSARDVRGELHEIMRTDASFEQKAREALALGREYLDVDNAHLTRIDTKTDHWETLVSTDPPDGQFPPGLELDLKTTYCRRTIEADTPVALHDAPEQGWADDPAFREHGLHCYHGTTIRRDGDPYGTVCFVATDSREAPFSEGETMFAELLTQHLERELEREQHEAELTRRATLVNILNRVLRHNLRNDMAVIRGHTRTLTESGRHADIEGDVMLQKIDEVIQLCEKARALEQIVTTDRDRQTTDIGNLVDTVVAEVCEAFPAASVTVEYDEDVPAAVLPSFERAIQEVVENAVKHGGDAPTVRVTVENVPNSVLVQVSDDGPGLPAHERDVLTTGEETPLIHGSGLGLWLVYWIVTTHDGSVDATITDEGTTMTITIPRSVEAESEQVAELRKARDLYQAAFEECCDAVVIIDDEARIVDANPQAASIYERDSEELVGHTIPSFLPEDFDFEAAWETFQQKGLERDTVTIVGADGTETEVVYSATTDVIPGHHLVIFRETAKHDEVLKP